MRLLEELFFHKKNTELVSKKLKRLDMKGITITIKPDKIFAYGITVSNGKLSYTLVSNSLQEAFKLIETDHFANFVNLFFK